MSSLAASRADGYYFPPDYDPEKHGSLNQFRGQHPLRERAKKLDQGILVIRFEMPFNVWCGSCNHLIGKGVRFNAEKQQIGMYYSTRIWRFSMRCPNCSHKIEVETDPKNTEYNVASGARRKVETWTAENAETMELPDQEEQQMMAPADAPLQKLEQGDTDRKRGRHLSARVAELYHDGNAKFKDDYTMNRLLRHENRQKRREEKVLDCQRTKLGLSKDVKLLPPDEQDSAASLGIQFGDPHVYAKRLREKRRAITAESIFAPKSVTGPATATSRDRKVASTRKQSGGVQSGRNKQMKTF